MLEGRKLLQIKDAADIAVNEFADGVITAAETKRRIWSAIDDAIAELPGNDGVHMEIVVDSHLNVSAEDGPKGGTEMRAAYAALHQLDSRLPEDAIFTHIRILTPPDGNRNVPVRVYATIRLQTMYDYLSFINLWDAQLSKNEESLRVIRTTALNFGNE